jgi:hypothetical protein
MKLYTVYFIWKLLYMFRVVSPPIIRSANNCIYSIWYLSYRYCYLPLYRQIVVTVWQIPDVVDTVVCAPNDGWRYYPKHVKQFPDKINCVTLYLVGYILEDLVLFFCKRVSLTGTIYSLRSLVLPSAHVCIHIGNIHWNYKAILIAK